ncbi:MAG: GNAT family N-acetyltransferase [Holosporales bacterium]|nr:GNAT family N-acetyltransferase [Holosporales bacterium]
MVFNKFFVRSFGVRLSLRTVLRTVLGAVFGAVFLASANFISRCAASDEIIDVSRESQTPIESVRLELPIVGANCYLEALNLEHVNLLEDDCFSTDYYQYLLGAFGADKEDFYKKAKRACFLNFINLQFWDLALERTEYAILPYENGLGETKPKVIGLISVAGGMPKPNGHHTICTVVFEKYAGRGYATHARKIAAAYYEKLESGIDSRNIASLKAYTKSRESGDLKVQIVNMRECGNQSLIITPEPRIKNALVVNKFMQPLNMFFDDKELVFSSDNNARDAISYLDIFLWKFRSKELLHVYEDSFVPYYTMRGDVAPFYSSGKDRARAKIEERILPLKKIISSWLAGNSPKS